MSKLSLSLLFLAVLALAAIVAKAAPAVDPAALIKVTASGQIGVLLDEYPSDVRDRVATFALAQSDTYWTEAVVRQTWLAQYRLVYRASWYGGGSGKNSLPLPMDQLQVAFTSSPARGTDNKHDYVKRTYTLTAYIVTSVEGAAIADPDLGTIGGWTSVSFQFPVDPFLVFQRVGFSCYDEAQYPLGSADAENPEYYYDDTCGPEPGYDPASGEGCNVCHCSGPVAASCRSDLGAKVGKTSVTYVYTRLAYDANLVAQIEALSPYAVEDVIGADLVGSLPDLQHHYLTYRYVEPNSCIRNECVDSPGWRRLLNFDAMHVNVGPKMLEIGFISFLQNDPTSFNPLVFHNLYYWDPCHNHPHFSAYATYSFKNNNGHKQGFCVLSTNRVMNVRTTPLGSPNFDCSNQGVAPGWSDVYNAGITCQWVDVTNITSKNPVTAPLTMASNPKGWLCEGNVRHNETTGEPLWEWTGEYTASGQPIDKFQCDLSANSLNNNVETTSFTLPTKGNGLITRACDHVNHNLGPKRDCEFNIRSQLDTCTAGANVNLQCTIPNSAKSQVLRVCESSRVLGSGTACRFNEPHLLANAVIQPGQATTVSFKCPAARDAVEIGGRYSTYYGGVFNLDAPAKITCTPI
jgi:hypothetical protein